jgi:hypothetical protein
MVTGQNSPLRMRRELSEQEGDVAALSESVRALKEASQPATATTAQSAADNVLRNGECEFSHDAYDNNPTVGGDADQLCAHWLTHDAATTLLGEADSDTIKAAGHSAYNAATDDADWERDTGRLRLGSTRTIAQPLTNVLAQPDGILYLQFTATLRTATALPVGLTFYAGIWDNTPGQERWVSGLALAVTAANGGAAGATPTEYKVIVDTDKGEQYECVMAAPLVNAPNVLSAVNYVTVSWPEVPGRKTSTVYRSRAGVVSRVAVVTSGATSWDDFGDAGSVVGAFPAAALSALRARVQDNAFAPQFGQITRYRYAIKVPGDYAVAATQKQSLRLGLSAACTDARQIILDRFSLGQNYGGFQRGPLDSLVQNRVSLSASPTGGLPPASNYGDDSPPAPGDGGAGRGFEQSP